MQNLLSLFKNKINKKRTQLTSRNLIYIKSSTPLVSFTFDDFPVSASNNGGRILNNFGIQGTFYLSMKFLNVDTPSGKSFEKEDIVKLIKDGHEIGCHTFDHLDAKINSAKEFQNSIEINQLELNNVLGFKYKLKNFAYPFGRNDVYIKRVISKQFSSGRSTNWGINCGNIDLNFLKACNLYGKNNKSIDDIIHLNQKVKGWLVFYTHDVTESPTKFGCTPEFFYKIVLKCIQSGAKIVTVDSVLELLKINNQH